MDTRLSFDIRRLSLLTTIFLLVFFSSHLWKYGFTARPEMVTIIALTLAPFIISWLFIERYCPNTDLNLLSFLFILNSIGIGIIYPFKPALARETVLVNMVGMFLLTSIVIYFRQKPLAETLLFKYKYFISVVAVIVGIAFIALPMFGIAGMELFKFLYIAFLSKYFSDEEENLAVFTKTRFGNLPNIRFWLPVIVINFLFILLIIFKREFGYCLLLYFLFCIYLYIVGKRWFFPVISILVLVALIISTLWITNRVHIRPLAHVVPRFEVFDNPYRQEHLKKWAGWELARSLDAVKEGKLLGEAEPRPNLVSKIFYKDYGFTTSAHSYGLIGSVLLIGVFIAFVLYGFSISQHTTNRFERYLIVGITSAFALQALLVVYGNMSLAPYTGIPLLGVSYGKSYSIVSFIALGFMLVIADKRSLFPKVDNAIKRTGHILVLLWFINPLTLILLPRVISGTDDFNVLSFVSPVGRLVGMQAFGIKKPGDDATNPFIRRKNDLFRGSIYDRNMKVIARNAENGTLREYPFGSLFFHPVKYSDQTYGKDGVELRFNQTLEGVNNFHPAIKGVTGFFNVDILTRGNSLVLTLDSRLQRIASDALGDHRGAVVIVNPKTGEILAWVSKPAGGDPNKLNDELQKMRNDEDSPFVDRVTSQYPPGSVFKIVVASSALENNLFEPHSKFRCEGRLQVKKYELRCIHVHGDIDFYEGFVQSCNVVFASVAMKLGYEKLHEMAERFAIPADVDGLSLTKWPPSGFSGTEQELAMFGIGQSRMTISPLQLAFVVATVANKGVLMKPMMVKRVIDPEGNTKELLEPSELRKVLRKSNADLITGMMRDVVERGTGKAAHSTHVEIAGKTGTAETNSQGGPTHAWFAGFAPARAPELVVVVFIEQGGAGGSIAGPIAKRIFERSLLEN